MENIAPLSVHSSPLMCAFISKLIVHIFLVSRANSAQEYI